MLKKSIKIQYELVRNPKIISEVFRMSRFHQLFIFFSLFSYSNFFLILNHQKFSLLRDFTCAVARDEVKKHPEMQTIAFIELENNFPSDFS
jgi:hypothetical protein